MERPRGAEAVDEAEAEVETKRKSLLKTSALLFDAHDSEAEAEVETNRKSLMKTIALSFEQAASSQKLHDSEADGRVVWLRPVGPKLKQKQVMRMSKWRPSGNLC